MTKEFARFCLMLCLMSNVAACSQPGLTRRPLPTRPVLEAVSVQNCKVVDGVRWCEVTIEPALLNDENLKSHIIKIESEPVWVKPK